MHLENDERLLYSPCMKDYFIIHVECILSLFFFTEVIIKEYCVKIFFVSETYLVNLAADLWLYRKILVDMQ